MTAHGRWLDGWAIRTLHPLPSRPLQMNKKKIEPDEDEVDGEAQEGDGEGGGEGPGAGASTVAGSRKMSVSAQSHLSGARKLSTVLAAKRGSMSLAAKRGSVSLASKRGSVSASKRGSVSSTRSSDHGEGEQTARAMAMRVPPSPLWGATVCVRGRACACACRGQIGTLQEEVNRLNKENAVLLTNVSGCLPPFLSPV